MSSRVPVPRRPRRAAVALGFGVVLLLALTPAPARAGRYAVAQCDRSNRAYPDATFERVNGGDYAFAFRCEEDEDESSLQIHPLSGSPVNRFGRVSWAAPPGARIVGVGVEARMRNDAGHQARLSFLDAAGNEVGRIATGSDSPGGFAAYTRQLTDGGRERFAASLSCVRDDGCRASDQARNWIRSVRLTIDDRVPPSVYEAGSLTQPGWHRGTGDLYAGAVDLGAGVQAVDVRVNGTSVPPSQAFGCATIAGTGLVSRTQPCAPSRLLGAPLDTSKAPFVNGSNSIAVCAVDFGTGSSPGCTGTDVAVDNALPELAFASAEDPEDPELIRAPVIDRHSGVASGAISYRPLDGGTWRELPTELAGGELHGRIDSSAESPGRYLFRATSTDVAGNVAETSSRADGSQMVLTFPIRQATSLDAAIDGDARRRVGYGSTPELEASLHDAEGAPVAGATLDVVESFDPGSSLTPIARSVRTDERGRIELRLTRGPSRTIGIAYAGSRRYLAAETRSLALTVDGDARLRPMPRRVTAGRRVLFRGSVGTYGAAVGDGKLVELQVKGGGIRRYRTIRQAFRTDPRGKWSLRYGFDRFYRRPTKFRFRLKVSREAGWPYLAPAVSHSRQLTVEPRKDRPGD
jgi:hypothetical protein